MDQINLRAAARIAVGIVATVVLYMNVPAFATCLDAVADWATDEIPEDAVDEYPKVTAVGDDPSLHRASHPASVTPGELQPASTAANPYLDADGSESGFGEVPEAEELYALEVIDQVRTAGRGPKTGYERDAFGSGWVDDNGAGLFANNGCDTRNDILRRDLDVAVARPGTRDCVIESGHLAYEPYLGEPFDFTKSDASALQIDHIVPLSAAWQMGAAHWDDAKRLTFANDPLNLVAVDGPQNGSKGDSTPASWLPKNKAIRCEYALRYAQVSVRYDLPVTVADKAVMAEQCDG